MNLFIAASIVSEGLYKCCTLSISKHNCFKDSVLPEAASKQKQEWCTTYPHIPDLVIILFFQHLTFSLDLCTLPYFVMYNVHFLPDFLREK